MGRSAFRSANYCHGQVQHSTVRYEISLPINQGRGIISQHNSVCNHTTTTEYTWLAVWILEQNCVYREVGAELCRIYTNLRLQRVNIATVGWVGVRPLFLDHVKELFFSPLLCLIVSLFSEKFRLFVCLFLARQPPVGHGLLIHEVSRSHTTTYHSR